ncbi:MAG TPA: tetratricopeptide repeat protein [Methylocella sp.]|nr:tetratricopeptide repeat protein [Methylocella sp.]
MEIYISKDIKVVASIGFNRNVVVVTFDSYTNDRHLDRMGFAQEFLQKRGIDALHFITRENEWYQHEELIEAAEAARRLTTGYARVIAYGQSMGGYAAIRFGGLVGAGLALALSPQYSIDPKAEPFEKRWTVEAKRIRKFPLERHPPAAFTKTTWICFDPYDEDRRHADLYEAHTKLHRILTPNSGHPCTGFLAEIGLLPTLVLQLVEGNLDVKEFRTEIRRYRKNSAQLYSTLSFSARSPELRRHFAGKAMDLRPEVPEYVSRYADELAKQGRFEEAEAFHMKALAFDPKNPVTLFRLSECFELSRQYEKAVRVLESLLQDAPGASRVFSDRLNRLRMKKRLHEWAQGLWRPISFILGRRLSGVLLNLGAALKEGIKALRRRLARKKSRQGLRRGRPTKSPGRSCTDQPRDRAKPYQNVSRETFW